MSRKPFCSATARFVVIEAGSITFCYSNIVFLLQAFWKGASPTQPVATLETWRAMFLTLCCFIYCSCPYTVYKKGHSCFLQVRGKTGGSREDEVESRRASSRGLIPKAKVKTVKMTFVIIFVFILCWSPYIFFDLLQVGHTNRLRQLFRVALYLAIFWEFWTYLIIQI